MSGCGRNLLWARMPGYSIDAVALAIIADYMPSVLGDALEGQIFCTSLETRYGWASSGLRSGSFVITA